MAEEAGGPGAESGEKPEKVFTQEQLESLIQDRVGREQKRLRAELSQELQASLLVDEAFRKKALKEWDVEAPKGANGKPDDDTVKQLFGEWEDQHLKPVLTKAERLEQDLGRLRKSSLESDLLSAAGGKVQKALTRKTANGHSALFNMLEQDFEWDGEAGAWRVKGKDGYRPSPGGEKLYMEPEEYVALWMAQDDNKPFVLDTTQGGADFKGTKDGGGKRVYASDEYARLASDAEYYAKNRDELLLAMREGRVR